MYGKEHKKIHTGEKPNTTPFKTNQLSQYSYIKIKVKEVGRAQSEQVWDNFTIWYNALNACSSHSEKKKENSVHVKTVITEAVMS